MNTSNQPNILWICTDQQRFDTLGCYGNRFVHTPHIDRLAARGTLFQRAYCQSPICTPSRSSFLTGRYPRTTRCYQNGQQIGADEVLVTKLLHDAGYVCGLAGKLHLAPCHPSVLNGTEPRIDDGYDLFHWSHHPTPDWPTNAYTNWVRAQGGEYKTEAYNGSPYVRAGMPADLHQTTWCAEMAIDFIHDNAAFNAPWLFSVNIFDPHHAFDPPVEYLERYLDIMDDISLPEYQEGELESKSVFQRMDHSGAYNNACMYPFPQMSDADHRLVRASYWAMCDLIDVQVGRMLDALEESGQADNTVVIFMSDHGEMLGDHGIYLKGPYFYEPAIHVPLIISQPGTLPQNRRIDGLTELMDLAPTLLEAAGLPVYAGMQGRSLWPLLTGAGELASPYDAVYCEYYSAMPWHEDPTPQATMVRSERYKLVYTHSVDTGELYDLEADPGETINFWDDPAYGTVKADMLVRLCNRMAHTVDPLPLRQSQW